jgi:hypothetical protein
VGLVSLQAAVNAPSSGRINSRRTDRTFTMADSPAATMKTRPGYVLTDSFAIHDRFSTFYRTAL